MRTLRWMIGIAILLLLTGCGEKQKNVSNMEVEQQIESSSSEQTNTSKEFEVKREYNVKPNGPLKDEINGILPTFIEIPAIGVAATIENVGRIENGQMGVPSEMDVVGWFEPGPLPGERGNAVMAGHVDSKTGPAVFYKLDRLQKGDEIIIKSSDGQSKVFVVTGMETYDRKNAPVEDIFGFSYSSNLNLITCTGDFNRKDNTHEERLVVYSVLKSEEKSG